MDVENFILCELSPVLKNFEKTGDCFNFRCNVCGDSQKNSYKKRGYILRYKNDWYYKCHNCDAAYSFKNYLKLHFYDIYLKYLKDVVGKTFNNQSTNISFLTNKPKSKTVKLFENDYTFYSNNEKFFPAYFYLVGRKIPEKFYNLFYYTQNFQKFCLEFFEREVNCGDNDKRLIIPFFDEDKNLIGISGRSLDPKNKQRYVKIKRSDLDHDTPLVFGIDRLNINNTIYVVEGQFDSLFLPNSISVAGSDLKSIKYEDSVYIFDNEKNNKHIHSKMNKIIEENKKIVIWPKDIQQKDINDMIISGMSQNKILKIIKQNTYYGLGAKSKYILWKNYGN